MKYCLPLAIAILIGFTSHTAFAGGSLAARVEAAQAQAAQAQAAQLRAAQLQAAQLKAAQVARSQRQAATATRPPTPNPVPPAAGPEMASSGRINVADWFNQTPGSESEAAVAEPQPSERASVEAPQMASSRRKVSMRPPQNQDPAPIPPVRSNAISSPLTAAETESSLDLMQLTPDEPAALPTNEGTLLELHAADNATEVDDAEVDNAEIDDAEVDVFEMFAAAEDDATELFADAENDVTDDAVPDDAVPDDTVPDDTVPDSKEGASGTVADTQDGDTEPPAEFAELQEDADAEESSPAEVTPTEPEKEFSPQMLQLRDRIRSALSYYYQRPENIANRSPWGVMHALISYGVDSEIQTGRQRANAIGWLCYNNPCRGMRLLQFDGKYPVPRNGPGYQGHEGQFLSMLALSRVKPTYPIRVDGHDLTVQDLIEYEKYTCRPKTELTFKLVALAHYLPSDATWTSKWGETWSIPRLIQEELAQPINGACCGGTHRLIGYSMAVKVRQKRGEPLDGQWLRAQKYVDSYHKYVIKLQNRDGSFSTSWLKKRDAEGDIDRRIQTTGHILEWLVFSLPEDELTDPRIVRAATFLSSAMLNYRQKEWEIGPRGHALRALALYNERVFGDKPGERRALLARRPSK